MVKNFMQTQAGRDVDANVNQRLARVAKEVFVAAPQQVSEMITGSNLTNLPSHWQDAKVVGRPSPYKLISYRLVLSVEYVSGCINCIIADLLHWLT